VADLEVEQDAGTVIARINRPHALNAITTSVKHALIDALRDAESRPEVTTFVLTGTGRAFCAGADVKELAAGSGEGFDAALRRVELTQRFIADCQRSRLAVVTAVNGLAAGGGVSLALAGDIVIAAASARFLLLFGQRGLVPDGGLSRSLVQAVGRRRALSLALRCSELDADQALSTGLVDDVVPDGALEEHLAAVCAGLSGRGAQTVALTKRVFSAPQHVDFAVEAVAQAISLSRDQSDPNVTREDRHGG
jgi:2-(1,2-epoxy-1,2-dihydrophenyl)acetyl-CoA isomerase